MKLIRIPEPAIKLGRLAELWGCSSRFLRNKVKEGELEAVKFGRDWCVTIPAANDFFERRRVGRRSRG
jgi:excisionase family DNA binding protein